MAIRTMGFAEFAKAHNIDRKIIYNLTLKQEIPNFIFKDSGGHWVIDTSKAGAKRLIAEARPGTAEPENKTDVKKAREQKQIEAARLIRYKADQEEIKTRKMMGEYIDLETMRYYFTFFQRMITDSFAGMKKISPDLKRLYIAGQEREAEKKMKEELSVCFSWAMQQLSNELEKDLKEYNDSTP